MREMIKILLSACTVCAVGAALTAQADANPVPGQSQPIPPPPPGVPAPPAPTDSSPPVLPSNSPTVPGDQPTKPDAPSPTLPGDNPATPTGVPTPGVPTPEPVAPATIDPVPAPPVVPVATSADTDANTDVNGDEIDAYSYAWYEPDLKSGIGVSTILGGGVSGFTDKTMRSTTSDLGGLWDLRVTIGSHLPIALDVGYVGTATNINGLPTGNKGRLIGTTLEGALRWNVLPHSDFTPYAFAGMGWQRYDVTDTSVSLADSGVADHDNLIVFPMGVGMVYRLSGFVADVHGTFRAATDNDLVLTTPRTNPTQDFAAMHTWEASAAVGYEF